MAAGPRAKVWAELFLVCALAAAALVFAGSSLFPGLGGVKGWLAPVFFLYAPLAVFWLRREDFRKLGLCAPRWRAAGLELAVYVFILLPGFLLCWWVLARFHLQFDFRYHLPSGFGNLVLWHFLGVALPEELFFRGWLQGRLNQVFGRRWRLLGARVGPGLFIAALAFAGAHFLILSNPLQLIVFFPGLLFGLLRERSDSLFSPVVAHGLGNSSFLLLQYFAGYAW